MHVLPAPELVLTALLCEDECCERRQSLEVFLVIHLGVIIQQENPGAPHHQLRLAYDNILH